MAMIRFSESGLHTPAMLLPLSGTTLQVRRLFMESSHRTIFSGTSARIALSSLGKPPARTDLTSLSERPK